MVTVFSYDGLNRKTGAGFGAVTNGGNTTYESTIAYTYDSGNRLTQADDSMAGTITRAYDLLDHINSEMTPQGSISYAYDNANRRETMRVAGQPQVTYTYDDANRLGGIVQGTSTVGFTYDNANRRTSLTLPNGVVTNYSYDNGSELIGLTYQVGTNTLGNLTYTYDLAGRRTQVGGSLARTGLPAALISASYDAGNEVTNWNGTALSYDSNGNMLSDGSNSFNWNTRNQAAVLNGVSMQYDAFGRRSKNAAGTSFLYDGLNVAQELSGSSVTANLLSGGMDEVFSRMDASGTFTPLKDAIGSSIAIADSSGNIQTSYIYDPFGGTSVFGSSNENKFQYTGRENDGNGQYYYRARYYSPSLHRFVSQDPRGFTAGSTNLYTYAYNSPTNFRDPSGQTPCIAGAAAGVIIYDGYEVWREINAFMNGRKVPNAGWSGAWKILSGSAQAAVAGCAIADGASGLAGAGEGAAEAETSETSAAEEYSQGQYSQYENTTNPSASVPNITTDVTADEAASNLEANGYTQTSSSGPSTTYTDANGNSYTIRPSSSAPGGWAADYSPAGAENPQLKINFGPPGVD
jgi:RHS repeat-associated protein